MKATSAIAKLTPQQRAVEKKRALWRKLRAEGLDPKGEFDPDKYDWEENGPLFDGLSDEEWTDVWKHVLRASGNTPSAEKVRIRDLVDDAAYSSGWFAEYGGELHISRTDYRRFAAEDRRFLKKVQQFRAEMKDFFGEPPSDSKEPYDPWDIYRPIIPNLARLECNLKAKIDEEERCSSMSKNRPNAADPELDLWMARLASVWEKECGLPVGNTKPLRGFLLAALQPYKPKAKLTDRVAKHFIERWSQGRRRKA